MDLQKALGKHQVWRNEYIVEKVKPYCSECYELSFMLGEQGRTFHAIFGSATDLSENNLSFEGTKDNKAELD